MSFGEMPEDFATVVRQRPDHWRRLRTTGAVTETRHRTVRRLNAIAETIAAMLFGATLAAIILWAAWGGSISIGHILWGAR